MSHLFFILFISLFSASLQAEDDNLSSVYGKTITIASGYEQFIKESPSSVSVITSEDIEKIGAVTINDVLSTISGINVSYTNGFFPVYSIRGIGSTTNSHVLIYLDGIPINSSVLSSSYFSLGTLAKNISRIEIIKGSVSALYGADAFSGVINIISKRKEGAEIGVFAGSFDTYGGWMNHGYKSKDIEVNFSAQGIKTNGSNGIIDSDRQTMIDQMLGASNSLAPGSVNRGLDEVDIKVSLSYKDRVETYLRYIRKSSQNGVGIANSIDNNGLINIDSWITGFKLNFGEEDFKTVLDLNYMGHINSTKSNLFPKGILLNSPNTAVINHIEYTAHDFSGKLSSTYKRYKNHIIHFGTGVEYDIVNNTKEKRNFIQGPLNSLLSAGELQTNEALGLEKFADSESRINGYGYIQDEWNFTNDLSLTAGVRLDYFSDFGLSVNPRASLVWDVSSSTTTKLMYGKAFRAPSFFELYSNEGSAATGNPDLDAETINTLEWSIHKLFPNNISTEATVFWYQTKNLIQEEILINKITQSETRRFTNSDGSNTFGLELVLDYSITNNLELDFNYTLLDINPVNSNTDRIIITAPRHQLYAEINWRFTPIWSANINSNSVIDRKRSSNDKRKRIKNYTKVNFSLTGKSLFNTFDLTFKINNLLNNDIREPSIQNTIPNDYPLSSRSYMGILSMNF